MIVTHVLKVRGTDIQNGFITHEDLDEELAGLQKMHKGKLELLACRREMYKTMDENYKNSPIQKSS